MEPAYGYGSVNGDQAASPLWIAFPLYYTVPVVWFSNFLFMDKHTVGGAVISKGVYVNQAMEDLVTAALRKPGWSRLVVWEHDVVPPLGAFNRIVTYQPEHAIVGSMIFQHNHPHKPMLYQKSDNGLAFPEYPEIADEHIADMLANPGLYEVGAVAFGFTSIARWVLEEWPDAIKMFTPETRGMGVPEDFCSHDIWFCFHAARKLGAKVFADSAMRCEHLTEVGINASHHRRVNTPQLGELEGPPQMDIPLQTFEIVERKQ